MNFSGKNAVVTGAASGMGFGTALRLAQNGVNVVMCDINKAALEDKVKEVNAVGKAIGVVTDVRDYAQVVRACDEAVRKLGSIDYLVCCAGGSAKRILNSPERFEDTPIEVFDWGIDVNLKGAFYFAHRAMKEMSKTKFGSIVVMGSVSGIEGGEDASYAVSKSGLMYGLTRSLAKVGAKYNVRANCVAPGPVLTRDSMKYMKTLMKRAAEPDEIINVITFLLSDEASAITGSTMLADCGRMLADDRGWGEYSK